MLQDRDGHLNDFHEDSSNLRTIKDKYLLSASSYLDFTIRKREREMKIDFKLFSLTFFPDGHYYPSILEDKRRIKEREISGVKEKCSPNLTVLNQGTINTRKKFRY